MVNDDMIANPMHADKLPIATATLSCNESSSLPQQSVNLKTSRHLLPTDAIGKIELSRRSYNALRRAGIHTIDDLLSLDNEQLSSFKNLGAKSIAEIERIQNQSRVFDANILVFEEDSQVIEDPVIFYVDGTPYYDIPLKELSLPFRANRILAEAGYDFASKLIGVTFEELLELRSMGVTSANQIISKVQSLSFVAATEPTEEYMMAKKSCADFLSRFIKRVPAHSGVLLDALLPYYEEAHARNGVVDLSKLYEVPALRTLVVNKILDELQGEMFGIKKDLLLSSFPDDIIPEQVVLHLLDELWADNKIRLGQTIEIRRPTLWEYVETITDEKQRRILYLRLSGKTLNEIGELCGGVTRERIRQIIKKCLRNKLQNRITIEEDKYCEIYKQYTFTREDFLSAFGVDESTYAYVTLVCEAMGDGSIEQFVHDEKYPIDLRKGAERVADKDFFIIDGIRIPKERTALVDYVVHTYFQDEAEFGDFEGIYNIVLDELGESDNEKFILNMATYRNRLSDSDMVLWKYPSRFRYYDMVGHDFTTLIDELSLEHYVDIEYSSLKLYRSHPELMDEYDLRDEYELHNLLKKLHAKSDNTYISFTRMPMIKFGNADRDNQVLELLMRLAPISVDDFCAEYEAEYGVLARTVAATFISCIDEYRRRSGIYDISVEALPLEHVKKLHELLKDDYYDIAYIKQLYQEQFVDGKAEMINSYTLKNLGFNVLSSYVVKNQFSSASEYFRHLLTSDDYVDARKFPTSLKSQVSYTSELYSLRKRYEIVEYEPHRYVSRRVLEAMDVTIASMKDYSDKVVEFIQPDNYFTIQSLKKQGFNHPMHDDVNFGDWFFASILSEKKDVFRYQRIGDTKVFRLGSLQVLMEDLFEYILEQYDNMPMESFLALLAGEYGISIDKSKAREVLNISNMHYNKTSGIIHAPKCSTIELESDNLVLKDLEARGSSSLARKRDVSAFEITNEDKRKIIELIAEKFTKGLRLSSSIDFERFKDGYSQMHGEDFQHDANWFNRFVASESLIYDERAYFYGDDVIEKVRMHLDSLSSPCVFIDYFYNRFADDFYSLSIFSIDKLKVFIERNFNDTSIKWDYIFMDVNVSPADVIRQVFDERESWTFEELFERLPCLKQDTIRQTMNGVEYFRIASGTYTHIDNLDLPNSEGEKILSFVKDKLQVSDYVTANDLDLSAFENLNNHCMFSAVRDAVFQKFLSDMYDKSGQIITRKGEKLRAVDVLEQYCRDAETVSFDEINGLEMSIDPNGASHSACLIAGHNVMVRVSKELFVAEHLVNFDIDKIDNVIALFCTGNFIPLRGVTDFSLFPYTGYPWNLYLLESYVRKFSRIFKYDVRAVNSSNIGIIVRRSFSYSNYDEILAHALAGALLDLDDNTAAGNYLFDSGYIGHRKIGKEEKAVLDMAKNFREEV